MCVGVEHTRDPLMSRMAGKVGAYDLIGWTRNPGEQWMARNADGSDGAGACWASAWADFLQQQVRRKKEEKINK